MENLLFDQASLRALFPTLFSCCELCILYMKPSHLTPLAKNHLGLVAQKAGYRYLPDKSLSSGWCNWFFNPFNPKIKIKNLLCHPYSFTIEVVGRS